MNIPFHTHRVFITLDDEKIYELENNFTKTEISKNEFEVITEAKNSGPFLILHKKIFDFNKSYFLKKSNPHKIDKEAATTYNKIGFISDKELTDFITT